VVGLYLNPPDKAVVLCVDEKSQVQALDRTAPILPLRPGLPEKQTHDYVRHGTTTLFAALDVATGKVVDACYPRHRHQEFLAFTRQAIRRGTFTSVKDLIGAIGAFIDGWNQRCQPFVWTKPADQLLDHCRPSKRTSFTRH